MNSPVRHKRLDTNGAIRYIFSVPLITTFTYHKETGIARS